MLNPKTRPASYTELEALPPNVVGEILYGVLHAHPRPAPRHSRAATALGFHLGGPFDFNPGGPGGWIFLSEPELHLGEHVIVPDSAGWRRDRMLQLPDTAYIETPPDWVAEILSPSTQRIDRTDKLAIYAEFEVGHAWYIDPIVKTLEAMTLIDGKWQITATFKDDDPVTAPPFEVHTFGLDALWLDPSMEGNT